MMLHGGIKGKAVTCRMPWAAGRKLRVCTAACA